METKKYYTYQYKIQNFDQKDVIKSEIFTVNDNKWILQIYLYGNDENNNEYVSVFLECINPPSVNNYFLYIQDSSGKSNKLNNNIYSENKDELFEEETKSWGYKKFIQRNKIINNDYVIFCVDIEIIDSFVLNKKFDDFFNNSKLSDIKFIIEGKELYASKIILCSVSDYFKYMFESEMKESNCDKNNPIYLKELMFRHVYSIFHYIYTGKLLIDNNSIDEYMEIYKIADMFNITNLVLKIKKYLIKKIDTCNINKLLSFSEGNDIIELREDIIKFICKDSKKIIKSEAFKEIINNSDINIYNFIVDIFDNLNL